MPVWACTVHSSPWQDRARWIFHLHNLGHSQGFAKLSKSSLSAGINALSLKKWEAELGSIGLLIYVEHRAGNGWGKRGREGRQESVGFHSQPIKAATCTLTRDHIPRYISSCEGYGVWHPSLVGTEELCRDEAAFGVLEKCRMGLDL